MHISIIDDEKLLVSKIIKKLESNGYVASAYYGYEDFMRNGNAESQLYIVDVSLGDGSGFDIIKWLRKNNQSQVPIIMVSGYGDSENIIYGLDIGADDYIIKPLIPEELIARIKAMFRRPNNFVESKEIQCGDIIFDQLTKKARIGEHEVYLTKTESLLFETFLMNRGSIISREKMITQAW